MCHIDTVPGKTGQLPFPHAGMNRCQDNGLQPGFTDFEQSVGFSFS